MRIFRHYDDVTAAFKGAVVAIGNFDGVHRGHQALIARARFHAYAQAKPVGVLAFEPHPQEFFRPSPESFRLTPFRAKSHLLAEQGVDVMYALAFDAQMAAKSAQEFVIDVLVKGLGVSCVLVGAEFQFGKGRAGDAAVLSYMGKMEGFGVEIFEPMLEDATHKISSTHIREALKAGKPDVAARPLGHFWSVESRVERGDGRGRTIGVPTANMHLVDTLHPAYGVYAVRATIYEDDKPVSRHDGVANFGIRPMWETKEPLLETWLFDFDGDLYGKHMAVEFIHYIRGEAKLDGLDALKAQIAKDAEVARRVLGQVK
jgi:riboflavin kinase/FMN adenylyltransferase